VSKAMLFVRDKCGAGVLEREYMFSRNTFTDIH